MAVKAFERCAPFIGKNFEVPDQREYIMNALLSAACMTEDDILESIFTSLCDIARVGYDYIEPYVNQIGALTYNFINSDKEKVGKLCIEVWTSLCEVEIDRTARQQSHKNIVSRANSSLIDIIIKGLSSCDDTVDPELDDEMDWPLYMQSACALENLA